jgi:LEA14-like dessication related protein
MRSHVLVCLTPLLGACAWLSSVAQRPTVSLRSVDLKEISFTGLSVDFVLAVTNPNPIGLDLARLVYQITVDGHQFVEGAANQALHLPAEGVGEAHVPVSVKFVDLAESLEALFTKRTVPYTLATRLGFGTPVGVLEVPLSTSGTFPVPQLPDVHFVSAALGDLSLAGADLVVQLGVRNPNSFAVPFGNLSYQLSVAGTPVISSGVPVGNVGPSASSPVPIRAHLDFLGLGLGLAHAVQAGGAEVALDGQLDLGSYKAPLHLSGHL